MNSHARVILEIVKSKIGVSFVDVEQAFERAGLEFDGGYRISKGENLVLWSNWNEDATEAITHLFNDGQVELKTTNPLTYWVDGKVPSFPVAKSPNRKYRKPHWLPVTIAPSSPSSVEEEV
jgi:hypothetical protein